MAAVCILIIVVALLVLLLVTAAAAVLLLVTIVVLLYGNVDFDEILVHFSSVHLQGFLQGLFVLELDITKAAELVGLLVAHHLHLLDGQVLEDDVNVSLYQIVGQVAHKGHVALVLAAQSPRAARLFRLLTVIVRSVRIVIVVRALLVAAAAGLIVTIVVVVTSITVVVLTIVIVVVVSGVATVGVASIVVVLVGGGRFLG